MLTLLVRIAAVVVVVYLVLALLAWVFQERMALPGARSPLPEPESLGIEGERVEITTGDSIQLTGWFLPPESASPAPALLWFHGNMETVDAIAPILASWRPTGFALLAINYRGYGDSEGSPSEEGIYRDAEAAWAYLKERPEVDSSRISVYGRSIGSAAALYLAERRPVSAVVLDSPFTSARDMAERHYRLLPTSLVRLSLDNAARMRNISVPVLIFHGTDDQIAPVEMSRRLVELTDRARLVEIPSAGHNDTYVVGDASYRDTMAMFLRETERESE